MADAMTDPVVLDARFLSKRRVDPTTPLVNGSHCEVWIGRIDDNGLGRQFGRFWYAGKPVACYRVALAAKLGVSLADLAGVKALHECDNPLCCNEDHLHGGTQSQNIQEMWDRGRRQRKAAAIRRSRDERDDKYLTERYLTALVDPLA